MGFLDNRTEIIDFVLTDVGKKLLASGKLEFDSWAAFDTGVDYDPYISNSGSFSEEQLNDVKREQIEATLVTEALAGNIDDRSCRDMTNLSSPLFTVSSKQSILPRLKIAGSTGSLVVEIRQTPVGQSYRRFDSTKERLSLGYGDDKVSSDEGFNGFGLSVMLSGSDGLKSIDGKIDSNGSLVYGSDLVLRYT